MTHVSRLAMLGLAITLGAAAMAGTVEAREPRGPQIAFETLDTNSDGQITREELAAHRAARFATIDTNGDGMLNQSELEAQGKERGKKRAEKMMKHLDANEDGQLTQEEMESGRRGDPDKMFKRVDADEDGVITKAEFDAMKEKGGKGHKHKH